MMNVNGLEQFIVDEKKHQEDMEYLQALEAKEASLEMLSELPPYEQCKQLEAQLKQDGKLTFQWIFKELTGFYFFKLFLISEYAGEKAIFVKDVENYKSMRFESARTRVARLLYERFVAAEDATNIAFPRDMKYVSTFVIIQRWDKEARERGLQPGYIPRLDDEVPEDDRHEETLTKLPDTTLQVDSSSNAIGVYGHSVEIVRDLIEESKAPANLFDEVAREVLEDISLDVFPRFLKSPFYQKYIRTKWIETKTVSMKDFTMFRLLGRGGFGAVSACRKNNSGALYAMKVIHKRLVQAKNALSNIMAERDVLIRITSQFVTNIKYAFQDEEKMYIVMDLLLGGDLKFHLINERRFLEERARFYAAEVLLGLEHLHSLNIIYRDLKLENVLLDEKGHAHLSDLGLAVISKKGKKITGYAGTPGDTAPEMIDNRPYGADADLFSFGVLLYRMLCGSKPFNGRDLDKAVMSKTPKFPSEFFSREAKDLLQGLLEKNATKRLGCGPRGVDEIKEHAFFASIDWGLLEAGYLDPPFVPNKDNIHAPTAEEIGDFDMEKYRNVHLGTHFRETVKRFDFVTPVAVQQEMVLVLEKVHENVRFEKFSEQAHDTSSKKSSKSSPIASLRSPRVQGGGDASKPAGCCVLT